MATWTITLAAEILRWLPAKIILRFRSVSKQWASFCSEPYFAKLRRQNLDCKLIQNRGRLYSLDQDSLDCALEIDNLLQNLYSSEVDDLLLDSDDDSDSDDLDWAREFDDRFKNSDFGLKYVLGCSDGMLCMSVHEYHRDPMEVNGVVDRVEGIPPADLNRDIIVICDLSTGARRVVPPSPVEGLGDIPTRRIEVTTLARPGSKCPADWGRPFRRREDNPSPTMPANMWRHFTYGFGFDPSGKDYKLVRISRYLFRPATPTHYNDDVLLSEVKVYSMKTDSWSKLDQDIAHICINDRTEPAIADGVLYWIAGTSYAQGLKYSREMVVAFDLADESFLDIAYEEEDSNEICLGSMGGKLCVMTCGCMNVKLWKIEKHGDVWILLGSFRASVQCLYTTMHFSKNGNKVLVVQQEFRHCRVKICFDLAKETWSTLPMKLISMEGKVDMV